MIPENITKEHLLKAIEEIDRDSVNNVYNALKRYIYGTLWTQQDRSRTPSTPIWSSRPLKRARSLLRMVSCLFLQP